MAADLRMVRLDQIPIGNEIAAWIECGYAVSEKAGDIVLLALGTGLRWGEFAGLAPFEHDYENSLLTVAWIVKRDGEAKYYINDLRGKSDNAIRTIRLPHRVNEMLHRRSKGLPPATLIFSGAGGKIWDYTLFHRWCWKRVIARAIEQDLLKPPPAASCWNATPSA
jgi:hypothetical protein